MTKLLWLTRASVVIVNFEIVYKFPIPKQIYFNSKFMLKTIPENDIIELKHITHIQDESSFIVIYTSQSKNYISEEAFDKVEKVLNNSGFIKVNHNTLINISFISNNINFGHKRSINIFGITYINVSRRKMQLLKDVIKNRK